MQQQAPSIERPPKPARALGQMPTPSPTLLAPVRKRVKRVVLQAIDRGWFGLIPLQLHVVICGFPRSGTTLLQLMAEAAFPEARVFGKERSGLAAAQNDWPGRHPLVIAKRPDDIFWIDEIRESYATRGTRARPRFIVSVRDPRAVLTSVHGMNKSIYWVTVDRWRAVYEHYRYARQFDDVVTVEYRDLVERVLHVQQRMTAFIGHAPARRFDEYQSAVPANFDTLALNGVRPLDPSTLDKWRAPKHRERMRELLRDMPELPDRLVEMGYERDASWVEEYA
jgi:hypothetical protein